MKIEEKTVVKYFDIVLLADKKDSFFGINIILIPKYFKADTTEEKKFINNLWSEIKQFSEFHGYFEFFPNGHCKLTEKGLLAKKKDGHLKYQNSLKPKTPWLRIIPIILTSLLLILGYLNYNLKENQADLIKKLDTITKNHVLLKFENDSLKSQNIQLLKLVDSLVSPYKLKIDKLYLKKVELIESTKTD